MLDSIPANVTKTNVGLGNVDNTSDLLKPISTAVQSALNLKVNTSQVLTNVPADAKFTDTIITVVDNLTTNSATSALSARQGMQLLQSVSDGKTLVAGAITGKGILTNPSDTYQKMATNINAIETDKTGDATAIASNVLLGKTAYAKGVKLVGTMPNYGTKNGTITTQGGSINILAGYTSGGTISAFFANLVAENIKDGVNVGGVVGNFNGTLLGIDLVSEGISVQAGDPTSKTKVVNTSRPIKGFVLIGTFHHSGYSQPAVKKEFTFASTITLSQTYQGPVTCSATVTTSGTQATITVSANMPAGNTSSSLAEVFLIY
jgi:hypothetical protein